jgi:hypothetical protein
MFNIEDVLNELSKKRPVFHSEADFQYSLAWEIHEMHPDLNIRLEKREEINGEELYLDIFIFGTDKIFALELKYKTKRLDITISNEDYHLKDQRGRNTSRYDFCKDIERLERVLEKYPNGMGFVIFLTNDDLYWKTPQSLNTTDKDFRIHEGRTIKGTLKWKEGTSKGTMRGRENPVKLDGEYSLRWKDYSDLKRKNGKFRYLLVKVKHGNGV